MSAGRPPGRTHHVMPLDGGVDEKHRLRVILDVIAGAMTVNRACEVLGVSEARFHQIRKAALQGALDGLAPKPSGRPRTPTPDDSSEVEQLRRRNLELELDLQAALVRTELALAMPQVLMDRAARRGKKNSSKPPS